MIATRSICDYFGRIRSWVDELRLPVHGPNDIVNGAAPLTDVDLLNEAGKYGTRDVDPYTRFMSGFLPKCKNGEVRYSKRCI